MSTSQSALFLSEKGLSRRAVARLAGAGALGAMLASSRLRAGAQEATPTGARLTVYSGRNENLVGPFMEAFTAATGIEADVRYAGTGELAVTILEEGDASPADVFFAQDAGALGLLEDAGLFTTLPEALLDTVDPRFRSETGAWTGASARARVLVYNTEALTEDDVPATVAALLDPAWSGKVGWAPTNASFQTFVTAFRVLEGDDAARAWLEGMVANGVVPFDGNTDIVMAVGNGELDLGLVNHYYLYAVKREEGDEFPIANRYLDAADPGALVNIAGAGILGSGAHQAEALAFMEYLLSEEGQAYFATETSEYPVVTGVASPADLPPLAEVGSPEINLTELADLEGTVAMLTELGIL
ncbi:MAG: iron ABC transporter substrate-binding protein [Thermomicrobiales bacterium]|nr:iron ABC transporter substrate-binding protein [Thermomicrobiales bacterium]